MIGGNSQTNIIAHLPSRLTILEAIGMVNADRRVRSDAQDTPPLTYHCQTQSDCFPRIKYVNPSNPQ